MASSVLPRAARRLAASLSLSSLLALVPAARQYEPIDPLPEGQALYEDRDNVEGSVVRLATFPVRPMVVRPAGDVWAVNHHRSTVEHFVAGQSTAVDVWPTLWDPVSVAWWTNDTGAQTTEELVVVCRASWAVQRIDPATGTTLGVVQLRPGSVGDLGDMSEPADIVIDPATDRAFVSCTGGDSVLQIDLAESEIERIYHESVYPEFRCKAPLHLFLDSDGTVLVAPLLSGNNTMSSGSVGSPFSTQPEVLDLSDTNVAVVGLPDQDLFRIDPSGAGSVTPVAEATGAILFAHGINTEGGGDHWQLNTDARNAELALGGEPAANGQFARNRISITTLSGSGAATPHTELILDDGGLGGAIGLSNPAGQPVALTFDDDGNVFVAGLLTDSVHVLDEHGGYVKDWSLQEGDIPRAVLLDATDRYAFVYCWGTNRIRVFSWKLANTPEIVTWKLGADPAPAEFQEGRELFYDAHRSRGNNLSCATCHVEGSTDLLVWNLSDEPFDQKGPLLTQTLVGLERLQPFHWRGERTFGDFRGAFQGLLGSGTELPESEFLKMQRFLFELRNPAGRFQSRDRVVDSSISYITDPDFSTDTGDAVVGQSQFRNVPVFFGTACNTCHAAPTGTVNQVHNDSAAEPEPRKSHFKVAPFHELWRRQQSIVDVELQQNVLVPVPFLGAGTSHAGLIQDVFNFVGSVNGVANFAQFDFQENVAAFLHQWDQGVAPAIHFAFLLDAATSASEAEDELDAHLMRQARQERNCDVVVFGTVLHQAAPFETRWYWNRTDDLFHSAHPTTLGTRTLDDFLDAADDESNVFLGVPVGMGERFGVDFDMDGKRNGEDLTPYDPDPAPETDPPGFVSGPTVAWATSRVARVVFETDEPTTAIVRYRPQGNTTWEEVTSEYLGRTHAVVLVDLEPGTDEGGLGGEFPSVSRVYEVEVDLADRNQNPYTTPSPVTFEPKDFIQAEPSHWDPTALSGQRQLVHEHLVDDVELSVAPAGTGRVSGAVSLHTAFKRGGDFVNDVFVRPDAADRIVVGRVFVRDSQGAVTAATGLTGTTDSVVVDTVRTAVGGPALDEAGPFLVGKDLSDANGDLALSFEIDAPAGGSKVVFGIDAVVEVTDAATWATNLANLSCPTACDLVVPAGVPGYSPDSATRGFSQWSFPDTTEEHDGAEDDAP